MPRGENRAFSTLQRINERIIVKRLENDDLNAGSEGVYFIAENQASVLVAQWGGEGEGRGI